VCEKVCASLADSRVVGGNLQKQSIKKTQQCYKKEKRKNYAGSENHSPH